MSFRKKESKKLEKACKELMDNHKTTYVNSSVAIRKKSYLEIETVAEKHDVNPEMLKLIML